MPSHPDRVRRNYTTTQIEQYHDMLNDEQVIVIKFTKLEIASWPYPRLIAQYVANKIYDYIMRDYRRSSRSISLNPHTQRTRNS